MDNFIIVAVLAVVVAFAARYVIKAKKSGRKCIGCPDGCACPSKSGDGGSCSCGCDGSKEV